MYSSAFFCLPPAEEVGTICQNPAPSCYVIFCPANILKAKRKRHQIDGKKRLVGWKILSQIGASPRLWRSSSSSNSSIPGNIPFLKKEEEEKKKDRKYFEKRKSSIASMLPAGRETKNVITTAHHTQVLTTEGERMSKKYIHQGKMSDIVFINVYVVKKMCQKMMIRLYNLFCTFLWQDDAYKKTKSVRDKNKIYLQVLRQPGTFANIWKGHHN